MNFSQTPDNLSKNMASRIAAIRGMQAKGGGRNAIGRQQYTIARKKFVEGETYIQLIPAIMGLPFDPETLDNDVYNKKNLFLIKDCSATRGVLVLKQLMAQNEQLARDYAEMLGVPVDKLNVHSTEVSKDEEEIWKPYRTADITSYPVQHFKFTDPAYKYGQKYRCEVDFDEQGDPVPIDPNGTLPLSVQIHQMETALIVAQTKLRTQAHENGELADRTDTEIKDMNKAAWRNRLVSNPFHYGVMRCVTFAADREFTVSPETVTALQNVTNYIPYEFYYGVNSTFVKEEIEAKAGSKKDRYFDFFALGVECKTKEKPDERENETAKRTSRKLLSIEEDFTEKMPLFVERYRTYRDDENNWKPEYLLNSVYAYRQIDDKVLLAKLKDDISTYDQVLQTKEILDSYSGLITAVDKQLGSKLLMQSIGGTAPTVGITAADLKDAPRMEMTDTTADAEMGGAAQGLDQNALASLMAQMGSSDASTPATPSAEELAAKAAIADQAPAAQGTAVFGGAPPAEDAVETPPPAEDAVETPLPAVPTFQAPPPASVESAVETPLPESPAVQAPPPPAAEPAKTEAQRMAEEMERLAKA